MRHLRSRAPTGPRETFELADTHWLHMWRDSGEGWRDAAGSFVTDRVVLNFIRISARDYPSFHERVALEELGAIYSEHLGLSVPDARELIEDFRRDNGPARACVGCVVHGASAPPG